MRYLKEVTWEVIPLTTPKIEKNCSKCGQHALFQNSEKFRVNANKNKIDVWLIYQCEKCKTTWNMTIYERIAPKDIPNEEYELFMNNDVALARAYGFNKTLLVNNRVNIDYSTVDYEIIGEDIIVESNKSVDSMETRSNIISIEVLCKTPFDLRMEKVLSQKLELSRSKIKKLCQSNDISGRQGRAIHKEKLGVTNFVELKLGGGIDIEIK